MKNFVIQNFDRLARRVASQSPTLKRRGESFDILEIAFIKAGFESAEFYEEGFLTTPVFDSDLELLTHAVSLADHGGLFLEFGVASGRTIRHLAGQAQETIYGFDSFDGLPEDWRTGYGKGAFSGALPEMPPNVSLVRGWFDDSLPSFLQRRPEPVTFLHIDCDLYSSTKTVLDLLGGRIRKGCVIQFDEYWNYPGWKQHEFRAFEEFKSDAGISCEPIGFVPSHQQVAFVVL